MNYKLLFLICIIVLIQIVKSVTVMTKNDLLNLDLKQYNNTEICPEFSAGKDTSALGFSCVFVFYCQDDNNCQPDSNYTSPYFEFTENDGTIKHYIKKMCPTGMVSNNSCSTEKCTSDSDCLSNKCYSNVCVADNKSIFTECSDVNDDTDFDNQIQIIKCGKPEGEQCKRDKECSGRCFSENTCNSRVFLTPTNVIPLEYLVYGAIAIFVVVFFLAVCICLCARCITRKHR